MEHTIVIVPKGSTAYQATKTLHYYGRTEFAATQLHDNVIRLLMTRGRVAHAVIELVQTSRVLAEAEYAARMASLQARPKDGQLRIIRPEQRRILEAPKRSFDEYRFALMIRNDGGLTIRDGMLTVSINAEFPVDADGSKPTTKNTFHFEFAADNKTRRSKSGLSIGTDSEVRSEARLYPEQTMPFPRASFVARPPVGIADSLCTMEWKLYLDNAPMNSGILKWRHRDVSPN